MQMALSRRSIKRKGAKSPRRKAEETNNQAQNLSGAAAATQRTFRLGASAPLP
jgi:ribosome assembly protein YihI (activator of Der GTPase)